MKIFTNSNVLQIKKIPDSFGALFFVKGKRKMRRKDYFTLIELLVSAACKTGVLYNRCGMLSLWDGALKTDKNGQKRIKTDIGAPQNTAYPEQYNACKASASCTGGALHICRRKMLHTAKPCFIQSAFTLIELLVVIAIIAILAAMLLPALQQARGRGDNASCQSNCRQIATAVDMYTGDFAGYYPMSATLQGDWAFELYRKNYVATPLIFSCKTGEKVFRSNTAKNESPSRYQGKSDSQLWRWVYIHYGYNYMNCGGSYYYPPGRVEGDGTWKYRPMKVGMFKTPSRKIMAADASTEAPGAAAYRGSPNIAATLTSTNYYNRIDKRHAGSANIIWIDGHVSGEREADVRFQIKAFSGEYMRPELSTQYLKN